MLTGNRAQLLPSQVWREGFPLLPCPVPRSSQAPGKRMDCSSLNFSPVTVGRWTGLTGVPQGAPALGARPRPCTNGLQPRLWISGWGDYWGSGTRQPPDSPFPSLVAHLQNQVAASPGLLGPALDLPPGTSGQWERGHCRQNCYWIGIALGLNPQSQQRVLPSANSRDDTQKNTTSFHCSVSPLLSSFHPT